MTEVVRTGRAPYASPVRAEQARATRRAIVGAAGELFVERGYAATTIDAVAERAGVGRKTVFSSVGGKAALLKLAWDWALVGDDEPVDMTSRPAVQGMLAERDPRRLVRRWADMLLDVGLRAAPLGAVLTAAADVDDEARALLDTVREESLVGARAFVTHLASLGGLRHDLDVDGAAEACWALVNSSTVHLLVGVRGWSPRQYGDWLDELAAATLLELEDRAVRRAAPVVRRGPERYDALVDGRAAGRLLVERSPRVVVLHGTEIEPGFDGDGVASALVGAAFDDVRDDGTHRVMTACPYVTWWVSQHPDLVEGLLHGG